MRITYINGYLKCFNTKNIQLERFCIILFTFLNRQESENQGLILSLEEANSLLQQEENRAKRAHITIAQVQQERNKMIKEKDIEMEKVKNMQQQVIDSLQVSYI